MTYNHATEQYEIHHYTGNTINVEVPKTYKFTLEEFTQDNEEELQYLYHNADERLLASEMIEQIFNTSNRNSPLYTNIVWEVVLD